MNGRYVLILVLAAGILSSCAKKGYPPGGPVDLTPPSVGSTLPDSGRAHVALDSKITISFSERMDRRSVKDWVFIRPPIGTSSDSWKGSSLTLTPVDSLLPNTTYTVLVGGGAKDLRGNALGTPKIFAFSTGDSITGAIVTGRLEGKKVKIGNAMVYLVSSGTSFEMADGGAGRIGQTDPTGVFRIPGAEPGTVNDLLCFIDRNGNRAYDEEVDILAKYDTRITVGKETPVTEIEPWFVADPKEPGLITGSLGDTIAIKEGPVVVILAASTTDSTAKFQAKADTLGNFKIDNVPAGEYSVVCFADLDKNGTRGAEEPVSIEQAVAVKPERETVVKFPPFLRKKP